MTITIPDEIAEQARLSPTELRIDLAAYLYELKKLTMGQARRLADLDIIAFQRELAKRNIFIHLSIEDLDKEINNLNLL